MAFRRLVTVTEHLSRLASLIFIGLLGQPHVTVPAQAWQTEKSDAALLAQAQQQPDTARAALSRTFAAVVSATSARERDAQLLRGRRLANAYARAWNDSFFVRQVMRFEEWSPAQRKARVVADSIRLAGNNTLGRDGVPAAMLLWRESLRRSTAVGDPAAIAPAVLAVGAGFYRLGQFDSATTYINKATDIATRSGDLRTTGNALGILASVRKDQGDVAKAAELYRRASTIRARSGDTRGIAADQNNLGLIAQQIERELSMSTRKAVADQ